MPHGREREDGRALLAARLKELLAASGLQNKQAASKAGSYLGTGGRRIAFSEKRISAWATGRELIPHPAMTRLVRVLIQHARGHVTPGEVTSGLLDEASWEGWRQGARVTQSRHPGSSVREVDPLRLGVHRAVPPDATESGGGTPTGLTPYLARPHDQRLRDTLAAAAGGGPPVFALLAGDSSTGKTRALYEALLAVAPEASLLAPSHAEELDHLLAEGKVTPGTVLWLNETQRFLEGPTGASAAGRLIELLATVPGVLVAGAMWRRPYLEQFTALGRVPDSYGRIRDELIKGPHTRLIDVPDHLTDDEQRALRALAASGDGHGPEPRLAAALDAGTSTGQVIQHLTGGPELVDAYLHGTLFTPVEHALVTAALDARRLGHYGPLPAALLAEAADGYLSARQRPAEADWATTALRDLTRGYRGHQPGDRTDIRRTLTALTTYSARSGTPPCYEPADYLDQHTRRPRRAQAGHAALWDALARHTSSPEDLYRLAGAARGRGVHKHAALFARRAVAAGFTSAGLFLLHDLAESVPGIRPHAALWIAEHTPLKPETVEVTLTNLQSMREEAAVHLLARRAAEHMPLTDPANAAELLERISGSEQQAVLALLARDPAAQAALDDAKGVAELLDALWEAGKGRAARGLARRAAAHVALDGPSGVDRLLFSLEAIGARSAARKLAQRAARQVPLHSALAVAGLLRSLRQTGAHGSLDTLLARDPAAHVTLDHPAHVASLLEELREAGSPHSVDTLLARGVLEDLPFVPYGMALLVAELRSTGAHQAVKTLTRDVPARMRLEDPRAVAGVLEMLRKAGEREGTRTLLARDPATRATLHDPHAVVELREQLRESGAPDAALALARRAAAHMPVQNTGNAIAFLRELRHDREDDAAHTLIQRIVAGTPLHDAHTVAWHVTLLRETGASEAAGALARRAAPRVEPHDPRAVAALLAELREAGAHDEAADLARRAAPCVHLRNPGGVAALLREFRRAGTQEAVEVLLARDLVAHVSLDNPSGVDELLEQLRKSGARDTVDTLLSVLADTGHFELFRNASTATERLRYGREPGGEPADPWAWNDLPPIGDSASVGPPGHPD